MVQFSVISIRSLEGAAGVFPTCYLLSKCGSLCVRRSLFSIRRTILFNHNRAHPKIHTQFVSEGENSAYRIQNRSSVSVLASWPCVWPPDTPQSDQTDHWSPLPCRRGVSRHLILVCQSGSRLSFHGGVIVARAEAGPVENRKNNSRSEMDVRLYHDVL